MRIRVPEAMTRFECNQQGCCCKGWHITLQIEDLERLVKTMHREEAARVLSGLTFVANDDNKVTGFRFRTVGPERACQFLAEDGRCGLQVERGVEVLPHLCRAFPGYGVRWGDVTDLCFNLECPEVLNCLDESDDSYEIVEIDVDPSHHLADRAEYGGPMPSIRFGQSELSGQDLRAVENVVIAELNRRERPVLESLASISYALARLAKGQPVDELAIRDDQPFKPFDAHFETCVAAHQPALLAMVFNEMRRLVLDVDLDRADARALAEHLVYRRDWCERLDPHDPTIMPLLSRYLAHRFHSPFSSSPTTRAMSFAYGTIVHCLATTVRYAVGLGSWLSTDVDRTLIKVSIAMSEEFYSRFKRVPSTLMPWFDIDM